MPVFIVWLSYLLSACSFLRLFMACFQGKCINFANGFPFVNGSSRKVDGSSYFSHVAVFFGWANSKMKAKILFNKQRSLEYALSTQEEARARKKCRKKHETYRVLLPTSWIVVTKHAFFFNMAIGNQTTQGVWKSRTWYNLADGVTALAQL